MKLYLIEKNSKKVFIKNYFDKNIFYFEKSLKLIHLEKSESPSKMLLSEYYKSMVFYYKYFNFNKYIILTRILTDYQFILQELKGLFYGMCFIAKFCFGFV